MQQSNCDKKKLNDTQRRETKNTRTIE